MGYPFALLMDPPAPTYREYPAVVARARELTPQFVDPANLFPERPVVRRRGADWVTAVLGRPYEGLGGRTTVHEQCLIIAADEAGINPPLPGWIVEARAESARRQQQLDQQRADARRRDIKKWTTARDACGVPLEVHDGSRTRASGHPTRHAVPTVDGYSGTRRLHRAGRALCETGNARPLQLAGSSADGDPATCVNCLARAPQVRATQKA